MWNAFHANVLLVWVPKDMLQLENVTILVTNHLEGLNHIWSRKGQPSSPKIISNANLTWVRSGAFCYVCIIVTNYVSKFKNWAWTLQQSLQVHFNVWTSFINKCSYLNNNNQFNEIQTLLGDHWTKNFPLNC